MGYEEFGYDEVVGGSGIQVRAGTSRSAIDVPTDDHPVVAFQSAAGFLYVGMPTRAPGLTNLGLGMMARAIPRSPG